MEIHDNGRLSGEREPSRIIMGPRRGGLAEVNNMGKRPRGSLRPRLAADLTDCLAEGGRSTKEGEGREAEGRGRKRRVPGGWAARP